MCSHQVSKGFSVSSQRIPNVRLKMFPSTAFFYPICHAMKIVLIFTYIVGNLQIRNFYFLGSLQSFSFFFGVTGQSKWLIVLL